jgi:hypothetical protein
VGAVLGISVIRLGNYGHIRYRYYKRAVLRSSLLETGTNTTPILVSRYAFLETGTAL